VLEAGRANIAASLQKLHGRRVAKGELSEAQAADNVRQTLARLTFETSTGALAATDLVIEAIAEKMESKLKLFAHLDAVVKKDAIFATNTSSLRVKPMAEASGRPAHFVGLHYFNPVQLMPLCEVVRTDTTDERVMDLARNFAKKCGKTTVDCIDTPGFIVNRLLVPHIAGAIAMAERGDASIEDIDRAMQLGAGNPMGPLTLADYVGLDTTLSILRGWVADYPSEPAFFVPRALEAKVARGKLGRKSGEGFYVWGDGVASTKPTGVSGIEGLV